jgi:hypothetical protein
MKLRFKGNTLRLRLNQTEVRRLAEGATLKETVSFPGNADLSYVLSAAATPSATFSAGVIRIAAPTDALSLWAAGDDLGLYLDFAATPEPLRIAIEKDLECVDGPPEDRDVDAFPRMVGKNC